MRTEAPARVPLLTRRNHHELQLGGPDGEIGAAMRYLNQRYSMPNPEIIGILTDVGTSEK